MPGPQPQRLHTSAPARPTTGRAARRTDVKPTVTPGRGSDAVVAVIPVRDLETSKSRLGEALDPEERQALVLSLLDRTLRAALGSPAIDEVFVVSPDAALRERAAAAGAQTIRQRTRGLGAALEEARAWAIARGAGGLLVLPADLPAVSSDVLDALVARGLEMRANAAPGQAVALLVPDRAGEGTNVLLMLPPDAIPFEFGPGSRQRHAAAALAGGALLEEVSGPLSLDVDTPEDLLVAESARLIEIGV